MGAFQIVARGVSFYYRLSIISSDKKGDTSIINPVFCDNLKYTQAYNYQITYHVFIYLRPKFLRYESPRIPG
jgi:hypothetical protein